MPKFIIALLSLVVITFLFPSVGGRINSSPGTGEKVGQIYKLTHQGVVKPTWEAELIRGGMNGGTGSFGVQPFDFTVPDELVSKVQKYMETETQVKIKYVSHFIYSGFNSSSGGYFLTEIEPVKE